jgi:hypothetical protein
VLPLTTAQIDGLLRAGRANWREVEPAIFGTLLERALDPTERHALGAHYTPRAYVERLVLPTVIEPLRADWANAQAAALVLAREAAALDGKKREAKLDEARAEVRRFHHQLCTTRVLDPACGSGQLSVCDAGAPQAPGGRGAQPARSLGTRRPARPGGRDRHAAAAARHRAQPARRRAGRAGAVDRLPAVAHPHARQPASVAEPVVHDYGNIECRDAVLAWDAQELATTTTRARLSRWDGRTFKTHPVTGEQVPDEAAQVPQWRYVNPRPGRVAAGGFHCGEPAVYWEVFSLSICMGLLRKK